MGEPSAPSASGESKWGRGPRNTGRMRRPSARRQTSVSIRGSILERNHTSMRTVPKRSGRAPSSGSVRPCTAARSHFSVTNVGKPLANAQLSSSMIKFILVRNPISVTRVGKRSLCPARFPPQCLVAYFSSLFGLCSKATSSGSFSWITQSKMNSPVVTSSPPYCFLFLCSTHHLVLLTAFFFITYSSLRNTGFRTAWKAQMPAGAKHFGQTCECR